MSITEPSNRPLHFQITAGDQHNALIDLYVACAASTSPTESYLISSAPSTSLCPLHPPSATSVCVCKPLVDMKITAAILSNIQYVSSLIPASLAIDNRKQTAFTLQGEETNVSYNMARFSLMYSFVHTTNRWH